MFRRTRTLAAGAAALLLALGLTSCSADSGSSGGGSGGTLTIGMVVPPASFAAAEANWANEAPYMQAVYDTLLEADPDGTIVPGLAEEFSWDDSKTVLTLKLRDGVKFTDGSSFNADVAAQNLERFKTGTSSNASYLTKMVSAVAQGDDAVVITLSEPDPAFLMYLTQNAGLQESAKAFSNSDVQTVPVGSGPYIFDPSSSVGGSTYVFTKNPDYWNPDHQHYEKLVMNVYANQTTVLNAISGGQVNASALFDSSTNDQVKAAGYTLNQELSETWNGLVLADRDGTLAPQLADVRVRQAINYAIDRKAMLQAIAGGVGEVTSQIFPPTSPSFQDSLENAYPYDPGKAKELMAEAGYADGFTLDMATSQVLGGPTYALIADQLAAIGITVKPTDYQGAAIIEAVVSGKSPAFYFQLQEDPTDYQISQFILAPEATWNPFHVNDPKVVDYIHTIQTGSVEEASAAGQDLNAYIVDQAWFAPFVRPTFSYASDPKTEVTMQVGGAAPSIWNYKPKN